LNKTPRLSSRRGFTLLELIATVTILAILVTIGVPSMQEMLDRNRLKMAAQALMEDLQWTRSETIRRDQGLFVTIDTTTWCYGISARKDCDCRLTDLASESACVLTFADTPVLETVSGETFPGVRVEQTTFGGTPAWTGFEPRRATAKVGSLTFASPTGARLRVVLSLLGRVRICSPGGSMPGYPAC
jgi:type IV fimbrial biogenesis protein FimT